MASFTRRRALALGGALAGAAALLPGCSSAPPADHAARRRATSPPPPRPGRLFADTAAGLAVADLATGAVRATYPGAVAEARWSRLYQLTDGRLRTYDAGNGRLIADVTAPGEQIKAVSAALVALGPPPGPRTRTTLTLIGADRPRTLHLDGNIEPEAFSPDGTAMYVLDRLPPAAPDGYRVRAYDLTRERMGPLQTRDKRPVPAGQEEEMRGQGRQAVLDPAQNVLYTLYTHQDSHLHTRDLVADRDLSPGVHAFVHVLHLDQRWAFCLDLPAPFGLGPAAAHTLALGEAGLYVFDASSGRVTLASTQDLTITRSALLGRAGGDGATGPPEQGAADGGTPEHAAAGHQAPGQETTGHEASGRGVAGQGAAAGEAFAVAGGGRLYLAEGGRLLVCDGRTLVPQARWWLPGQARGLAYLNGEVLAGAGEQVLRLDPATGARRGALTLPGLRALRHAESATG
ncbi:hypothetical protein [Nonomuraea gerenzanensis]|uniref:Secreted protein n=1 Tax=Nonomuraea gerenzanensis TaxID=93944 RepID=A0A1M4ECA7_9ACTN|nr:hypothetical protein [Nonomuraea gerenzanensis]UBU18686.1 hypothetical protein LCN96_27825 [Nonomuraea gerenzanensis]SBO96545.1 hypothetical protein BN4615_P6061 [Nonomuraea gerenzanensis]